MPTEIMIPGKQPGPSLVVHAGATTLGIPHDTDFLSSLVIADHCLLLWALDVVVVHHCLKQQ